MTLQEIREKNKRKDSLLDIEEINNQEYSEELIEQCKEEFETFVKPVGYKTLQRYLNNNMDKATELANKNTLRNDLGQVVISIDDEWRNDSE